MKNNQKGFVIPLLIAIIALLAIGGGVYVYENKKIEAPATVNTEVQTNQVQDISTNTHQTDQPSQPAQLNINSISPGKVTVGSTVTIHGKGFSNISRLNFFNKTLIKDGGVVSSIVNPEYISPDGTEIRFMIDNNFFVHGLQSNAAVYQIAVANIDCGNGPNLQCTSNVSSNQLNLEVVSK